jgi:hypothetical protein
MGPEGPETYRYECRQSASGEKKSVHDYIGSSR